MLSMQYTTRITLSLLFTFFISLCAFAQAVQSNNNDDQEDEEDFIVVGTPGLKPDTGHVHPQCAKPDEGPFSLWIEVRLANMNDIDLPCPLVVKATISVEGQEEPTLDIYSNSLDFTCSEEGFCAACPNIPLCRTYAIFDVPPATFYSLCSGNYGEKIEINITASLAYGCENSGQTSYYGLLDLETPGCDGYLPSACFNVNATGTVRGEGCLVCPELREETPDTIKVTSGMKRPSESKESSKEVESTLEYGLHNQTNLITHELILHSKTTSLIAPKEWIVVSTQGQIMCRGLDHTGDIRILTNEYKSGLYFIHITSAHQTQTIPWVKL